MVRGKANTVWIEDLAVDTHLVAELESLLDCPGTGIDVLKRLDYVGAKDLPMATLDGVSTGRRPDVAI